MALGAGVAAQLRAGLESSGLLGQDEGNVVVINEGHEGVVLGDSEYSLAHQLDEASLVSDVIDGSVDGDDDLAHLAAVLIELQKDMRN